MNEETLCKRRRNVNKLHKINKNEIGSSPPTLASERDDINEMDQEEEISMNNGTKSDLSEINQIELKCNGEKAQETPKKNFLQQNQNCDDVTVERKEKHNIGGRDH